MVMVFILMMCGYFLGVLFFGVWVVVVSGMDICKMGFGFMGVINVYCCVGKKEGIFVMFFDVFKGYIFVMVVIMLDYGNMIMIMLMGFVYLELENMVFCLVGVMSMIGYSKFCFLGFFGGKSVVIGFGIIIVLNLVVGGLVFFVFVLFVYFVSIVLVVLMSVVMVDVIFMVFFKVFFVFMGYVVFGGFLVIILYKVNIKCFFNGMELWLGEKFKIVFIISESFLD